MHHSIKNLPKGLIEISFSVLPAEYEPYLLRAAEDLSRETTIPGFRPGNAPYEIIKQRFGEVKILEAALPLIVKHYYKEVAIREGLETIDEPKISVTRLAPGNPLDYKLTVALLPKVNLGDWEKIHLDKKDVHVSGEAVDRALEDLRKEQTKEAVVSRPATKEDKVLVDMEMSRDNVPLEGGAAKNHAVYLNEKYYIPGLADELVGISAGETRKFSLSFPNEHYQKSLAGQTVDFTIKARDVYELLLPPLDDAFAQGLGQKTIAGLRDLVQTNLQADADMREAGRQEIAALDKIIAVSRFDEIPEVLINAEIDRMLSELEHSITARGLEFNKYLEQIKKSVADLKLEFASGAVQRVKATLVVREVAKQKNIDVSDQEMADEVVRLLNLCKNDAEAQKEIQDEEYQEQIRTYLKNRKTVELIRTTAVKQ